MDLTYTAEQQMFRSSVRSFLAERASPDRVAEIADGPDGWDPGLWKEAVGLGLAGVSAPEDAGGAGMGFVEETIVAEELGRVVFPGPWLGSVAMAAPALAAAPDLLRAVAAGERIATVAGLNAPADSDGSRLTGRMSHVVDLHAADLIVVLATSKDGRAIHTVERDDAEWNVQPTVDGTRRLSQLTLDGTPAKLLVEPGRAEPIESATRDRIEGALAAEALGVGARAIEVAVDHVRSREQFGKPIGSFQAVSHQLADAFVDVELGRSLVLWAVAAIEAADEDAPLASRVARRSAADAAVRACERSIQVHGGIGFTWEHPLHRWYRRALWIRAFRQDPAPRAP